MKKIVFVIVLILLIILFFVFNKKEENISEKPIIKIGASLPITGKLATIGDASEKSLNMAFEKWKNKDTKYNYELIIEDNQYDGKQLSFVANKLVNLDKVNAYISVLSKAQLVAKPYTEKNKVVNIGCSWGTEAQKGFYNINNMVSPNSLAKAMIKGLKKHNINSVALISQATPGAMEVFNNLETELEKNNIEVVFKEFTTVGFTDFAVVLQKIKSKNPDMIIPEFFYNELKSFIQQMKNHDVDIPITVLEQFSAFKDKELIEGKWFVRYIKPTKFSQELNDTIFSEICTANSYDSLDILINAFENVKSKNEIPTGEEILNYIFSMKTWDGITGKLEIEADGSIDTDAYLAIIKDGKVEVLDE